MVAYDMRPISIVENLGFRVYSQQLNPEYKVPSAATISSYIKGLYCDLKPQITAELDGEDIAITTDMWSSIVQEGYITVTCHFISSAWELKNMVIATRAVPEQHTGIHIRERLQSIVGEFGITKVTGVVTDNASNMVVVMETGELGLHIRCFSHTLQLVVNDALKIPAISKATGAARCLVSHLNHSNTAKHALKEVQEQQVQADGLSCRPLCLIQDVATRWHSTFLMLNRLLELRVPIYSVIFNDKYTKASDRMALDISDVYWKTMEIICPILEPFAEATQLLTSESSPTLSCVYVLLRSLWECLATTADEPAIATELKNRLRNGIAKRYSLDKDGFPKEEILTSPAIIATALDPRHKSLRVTREANRDRIFKSIEDLISDPPANGQGTGANPQPVAVKQEAEATECINPTKKRLLDCLDGEIVDLTKNSFTAMNEVQQYRNAVVTIPNPLHWWKSYEALFPKLAPLARKYLAIPASEVPSERAFSAAGQVVTKRRASLDPNTVDAIIFIKKNYNFDRCALFGKSCTSVTANTQADEPCEVAVSATAKPSADQEPALPALNMKAEWTT